MTGGRSSGSNSGFVAVERGPMDEYGMSHPVETPELLELALVAFEKQLLKLPSSALGIVQEAHARCPELCTKKFKIAFLRCEVFNPVLAAKRYGNYWGKRIEIFGEKKAFQPITLSAALRDDIETLKIGFVQCLQECRDARGRRIIYLDCVALNQPGMDETSMLRCLFYVLHCAMEDEATQKYGVVALMHPNKNTNLVLATTRTRMLVEAAKGIIPIRQGGVHVFRPPSYLKPIISIVMLLLTEQMRKRTRIHYGERSEDGCKAVEKYGISSSSLPKKFGGTYTVDMDAWIQHRLQVEAEGPRF